MNWGLYGGLVFKDNEGTLDDSRNTVDFEISSYLSLEKLSLSLDYALRNKFYGKTSQRFSETLFMHTIKTGVSYKLNTHTSLYTKNHLYYLPSDDHIESAQYYHSAINSDFLVGVGYEN